ncbi:hypothetical protein V500_06312 [Pseudogymnoascus sp. VKM F-4518 (FW-2643)]|nr:hypothetical protein V500_06312 [Pseudogymnoascus sp. VKM F-4518 (FW-2643)]
MPPRVLIHDRDDIRTAQHSAEAGDANADSIPIGEGICLIGVEEVRDGAAMMAPEIHVEPAHDDGHGRVGAHGEGEEGALLRHDVVVYIEQHSEADDRDAYWKETAGEALASAVASPSYYHGESEEADSCCFPGRDEAQLRLGTAVVQA